MNKKEQREILRKQKGFVKDIKNYIKSTDKVSEKIADDFVNEKGECQFDVVIRKEDMYNPLSSERQRRLNRDIYEFIENNAYFIPLTLKVNLNIITDVTDEKELQFIKDEINNHYKLMVFDKKDDIKREDIKIEILFAFGLFSLIAYFLVEGLNNGNALFAEILSIIGSFGIWGALDAYLDKTKTRIDLMNAGQLGLADITFEKLDDENSPKLIELDKTEVK